jgi:hypothetical protein
MPGDDRARFCGECNQHVYDLTAHTEAEGRALFAERKGRRTCVRFAKDETGAVRFKAVALAAAVSVAACSTHATDRDVKSPTCAVDTGDRDMGDGIPDTRDECPDTPAGAIDADGNGCPDPVPDAAGTSPSGSVEGPPSTATEGSPSGATGSPPPETLPSAP